jgi:putative transposase
MAVTTMDLLELLRKADGAAIDFLREGMRVLAQALMDAEVSAQIGAEHSRRTPTRATHRNGYRARDWDTRVGTIDLQIPRVREGSSLPSFLEPRRRAERALAAVVAQCSVEGVSTRRVETSPRPWASPACPSPRSPESAASSMSSWQRGATAHWTPALGVRVAGRPERQGPGGGPGGQHRRAGRHRVNTAGHREILGLELGAAEDGASWTGFLRGLVARGLSGVKLVISDAHQGLVDAVASVVNGASWQRCRTHFMPNLLVRVPRHAQPMVASLVRTIFAQQRPEDAWAQLGRGVDQLRVGRFGDAADLLEQAAADVLAYTAFPRGCWRQVWSNNPRSGSTARSAAAPTWWASSPTGPPRSGSWPPSSPSSTTNGRSPAAVWAPSSSPPAWPSASPTQPRRPPQHSRRPPPNRGQREPRELAVTPVDGTRPSSVTASELGE